MAKQKSKKKFKQGYDTEYYLDECRLCLYWQGRVRGCSLKVCCCEEESADVIANDYVSRKLNGKGF